MTTEGFFSFFFFFINVASVNINSGLPFFFLSPRPSCMLASSRRPTLYFSCHCCFCFILFSCLIRSVSFQNLKRTFELKLKKKKRFFKLNCIFFFFAFTHNFVQTARPLNTTHEFCQVSQILFNPGVQGIESVYFNTHLLSQQLLTSCTDLQVNQSMQGDSRLDTSFTLIHSFQPNKLNVVCTELLHTCFCKYS